MSGLAIVLGVILVVTYVTFTTGYAWTYVQAEERRIHLQSTPTDKSNVNTDTVKEQWIIEFNQLLSESQEVSDDN
jgi:predicted membrane protein